MCEQSKTKALANNYSLLLRKIISPVLNTIPIFHVYGSLGPLAWQSNDTEIPYDSNGNSNAVMRSYTNIDLIRTGNTEEVSPAFQKSHELLAESERIFFLGFGFDETNMRRLRLEQLSQRRVFATCLGLDISKKIIVLNLTKWKGTHYPLIKKEDFHDVNIYELFHKIRPLA